MRIYELGMETNQRSSEWCLSNEAKYKTPSKTNVLLTDYCGVVHSEYRPPIQTVTERYHLRVIQWGGRVFDKKLQLPHSPDLTLRKL